MPELIEAPVKDTAAEGVHADELREPLREGKIRAEMERLRRTGKRAPTHGGASR